MCGRVPGRGAQADPISKKPFSSRHLAECLERGATLFGWDKRQMAPGSMRANDGTMIGWGVAAGSYKAAVAPAIARLTVTDKGTATINVGVHEMGQGIRTALSNIVAAKLGIAPERVAAEIGTTGASPQHLTAGSWGTATAVPAASEAADAMLKALAELGQGDPAGRNPGGLLKAARRPSLTVEIRSKAPGHPDQIFGRLASVSLLRWGQLFPNSWLSATSPISSRCGSSRSPAASACRAWSV